MATRQTRNVQLSRGQQHSFCHSDVSIGHLDAPTNSGGADPLPTPPYEAPDTQAETAVT